MGTDGSSIRTRTTIDRDHGYAKEVKEYYSILPTLEELDDLNNERYGRPKLPRNGKELEKKYGITIANYEAMLLEQGGSVSSVTRNHFVVSV